MSTNIRAWYMFDNHTFAQIELGDRTRTKDRIRKLIEIDPFGSIFVRICGGLVNNLTLHTRRLDNGRWGIPDREIDDWVNRAMEEYDFDRLMSA